jgi:hypothetical protein
MSELYPIPARTMALQKNSRHLNIGTWTRVTNRLCQMKK